MTLNKKEVKGKRQISLSCEDKEEKMKEAPTLLFLRYDTHVICVSFLKIGMVGDKMMTIGPESMDHENNDPEAGQASISGVLFWEHNTPKLPNIQDVYWCTSTLHCQTPL